MPSKGKKHSKTPSRLSNFGPSGSPKTPFLSPVSNAEVRDDDFQHALEEASSRFPSLVGKSAFIGRISDVDTESRGSKIWLSEASMISASLTPGSAVSISLASSGMRSACGFPLSSIADEYGIDSDIDMCKEPGNIFFLAKVFPSSKVMKNGIRFSLSLHYGLGCPATGRVVFVHSLCSHPLTGMVNGESGVSKSEVCGLSLHTCEELYLELISDRIILKENSDPLFSKRFASDKSRDRLNNGYSTAETSPDLPKRGHNGLLASPSCERSTSTLTKQSMPSVNLFDIGEALRDENAKRLLQSCATSWLFSCTLLLGNLVAIPILSEMCIFHVKGAKKLPPAVSNQILANQKVKSIDLHTREFGSSVIDAFTINQETKVFLQGSLHIGSVGPHEKLFPSLPLVLEDRNTGSDHGLSKLGGLSKEIATLKDIIISSTMKSVLSRHGLRPRKGVLLHGQPGTGKTTLARLCVKEAGVNFFCVNGPEIVSQNLGESEQALLEVFTSASRVSPAVVFIDELDAIAPARREGGEELSQRIVTTLLDLMDGIERTNGVLVIAATNRPDSIDPALRRPGRLDREIEIDVPSPQQRLEILQTLLGETENSLSEVQVQHLAMTTHGFVGADLGALCNEARFICLRRHVKCKSSSSELQVQEEPLSAALKQDSQTSRSPQDISHDVLDSALSCVTDARVSTAYQSSLDLNGSVLNMEDDIPDANTSSSEVLFSENQSTLKVTYEDFEKARLKVRPSAMREVILEVPKVNWEDVGGQNEIKKQLIEAVIWPQKHQDAFKRIGARPPTGILMFGPPGCSKTLMARAVASEAGLNFLAVKGPELFSKWVGESEKAVRSLFVKARANAPSIVFFDEIDGLAVIRGKDGGGTSVSDRVMSQLLVELDGLHQRVDVTVIAATNRPDKIDSALLRPGRFDRLLYVGPPSESDREEIFRIHLRKHPCSSDVNIKELASLTESYTGADISWICRGAALAAIEESLEATEITSHHLKAAIRQVQPTEIDSYLELCPKFQRFVRPNAGGDGLEYQTLSGTRRLSLLW